MVTKVRPQGFELTVGTNHLGHFLLCNLLLKEVMSNPSGARIVVTASQVHDPASAGGNVGSKASLGDMTGLEVRRLLSSPLLPPGL